MESLSQLEWKVNDLFVEVEEEIDEINRKIMKSATESELKSLVMTLTRLKGQIEAYQEVQEIINDYKIY